MTDVTVHGTCDERFAAVGDAFAANFAAGTEVGASVAVTLDGESVVDMWAGHADEAGRPWERDTIVNVWSTTKTMAGTCMLMLADRDLIDFAEPVATYWPEFAQNGKDEVLVSHVMSHQAGLSGLESATPPDELSDWDLVVERLAAMEPWWEPGTAAGYHAVTQGFLQGEILRRVTGRTIGEFFRREVAEPLGADFHIGLPESEHGRLADLVSSVQDLDVDLETMDPVAVRTYLSTSGDLVGATRTPQWRSAEIPAGGGSGNARSVARVHSALACGGTVDGVTLMAPESVEVALQEQFNGTDLVMNVPMRYG
ncbi:MAG: serine hydrolase domain-containing protein, partial [Acidimicrobiales bacterium]